MNKNYTVIWSLTGDENFCDYITCSPDLSTQQMVEQAIVQHAEEWKDYMQEEGLTAEEILDEGYYLYAILEGHPRVVF